MLQFNPITERRADKQLSILQPFQTPTPRWYLDVSPLGVRRTAFLQKIRSNHIALPLRLSADIASSLRTTISILQ